MTNLPAGNRTRRRAAAWTLLLYVACGLTLTAHIAFADHHCLAHCDAAPDPASAGAVRDACDFDHHAVEVHHGEAVGKTGSLKSGELAPVPPPPPAAPDAPRSPAVPSPDGTTCRPAAAPPPSRAPPASPTV
jgi:hypothetical protein